MRKAYDVLLYMILFVMFVVAPTYLTVIVYYPRWLD